MMGVKQSVWFQVCGRCLAVVGILSESSLKHLSAQERLENDLRGHGHRADTFD